MRFALAGNQNCGKTTLFNQLTGSNQHVGNFPGVTVDSKSGSIRNTKGDEVVDLPGIYSLRPYSAEEIVTRDFILDGRPDGIINIVDATNIERNLYLTLQMIEMQVPMVLALNMMDEVRANGGTVDTVKLSELLGIPVVPISAAKGEGIADLTELACRTAATGRKPEVYDFCPPGPVHRCIHAVTHVVEDHAERARMSARWAAMNVIEGNSDIVARLALDENELELCEHSIVEMERETGLDRNAAIADMRYSFIESVCAETVKKPEESRERKRSRAIDNVLTHRIFALPIFVGIMLLVFYLTFEVIGAFLSDLLAMGIHALAGVTDAALTAYGINPVVHSLVIDGLFGGVGFGILVGLLMLAIAYLVGSEDGFGYGQFPDSVGVVVCLALGSLLGDMTGAFIKRRLGMARGQKAPGLDQYDFVAGAFLLTLLAYPSWVMSTYVEGNAIAGLVTLLVFVPLLHRSVNIIGYKMGTKKEPW